MTGSASICINIVTSVNKELRCVRGVHRLTNKRAARASIMDIFDNDPMPSEPDVIFRAERVHLNFEGALD